MGGRRGKRKREEDQGWTMRLPGPLPEGEWDKWGEDAVYFGAVDSWVFHLMDDDFDQDFDYQGVDIYAINPSDKKLPIYLVAHFSYEVHRTPGYEWRCPALAILGSRVYVLVDGTFWSRRIVGGSLGYHDKWDEGPRPCGLMNRQPNLFSLKGKLYALRYVLFSPDGNSFELFLDDHHRSKWIPLVVPPCPSPEEQSLLDQHLVPGTILGLSCIGDTKVIVHVPTTWEYRKPDLSVEQVFLLFQFQDGSDRSGTWTKFKIRPSSDPCVRYPSPPSAQFCPRHRSHLDGGSPLLLPVLPGKLHAFSGFGDFDSSEYYSLEQVPLIWPSHRWRWTYNDHEWHFNKMKTWNIIHLSGTRYCAFAFAPADVPVDLINGCPFPGLFVCTFDLVPDANTSGGKAAKVVYTNSKYRCWADPVILSSGKASSTSSSSSF